MLVHLHFISPLTVRQSANDDVLSGDARTVPVVGHHAETVLRVLLQSRHAVRLAIYVNILNEKGREGEERNLSVNWESCDSPCLKSKHASTFTAAHRHLDIYEQREKQKPNTWSLYEKETFMITCRKTKTLIALQCSIFIVFHSQQQSDKCRHLGPFQ